MINDCIYVCDADRGIRDMCTYFFTSLNYSVVQCGSSTELMKAYEFRKPDVILMDFLYPDPSMAEEVFRFLNVKGNNIPVILFSDVANIEEQALTFHANGYLRKPFDLDDLIGFIEKR